MDLGVDVELWHERVGIGLGLDAADERLAEGLEILLAHAHAGRHFMPPACGNELAARVERGHEGDARDAPAAPFAKPALVDPDDKGGSVVLLRDAGSDDAHDTGMPAPRTHHDGVAPQVRREIVDDAFRVLSRGEFELLALAVLPVERLGEKLGLNRILTKQ